MTLKDSKKHDFKFNASKIYHNLLKKSHIQSPNLHSNNVSLNTGFFTILFTLLWNGSIIYYLHTLEDASCKCLRDWRHNFMKNIAYLNITLSLLPLIINIRYNKYFLLLLGIIIIVLNAIYVYAFYTYIGILNTTKCSCALINAHYFNDLLYYYRSTIVAFYILGIITILIGINVSFSMKIHNKKFTMQL